MIKLLVLSLLAVSFPALSDDGAPLDANSILGSSLSGMVFLIYVVALVFGSILILTIIGDLLNYDNFSRTAENPFRQLIFRAVISAFLISGQNGIQMVSGTMGISSSHSDGFCFAYSNKLSLSEFRKNYPKASGALGDGSGSSCYDAKVTGYMEKLKDKLEDKETSSVSKILTGNARLVIGLFQMVATYFYFNSWVTIYRISEGKERQSTYGKQIIVIVVSTAFINLPSIIGAVVSFLNLLKSAITIT